jgi:hypothetical protein
MGYRTERWRPNKYSWRTDFHLYQYTNAYEYSDIHANSHPNEHTGWTDQHANPYSHGDYHIDQSASRNAFG